MTEIQQEYANAPLGLNDSGWGRSELCESILIEAGRVEEAWDKYGVRANLGQTNLGTFRAMKKKYPDKSDEEILDRLMKLRCCGPTCTDSSIGATMGILRQLCRLFRRQIPVTGVDLFAGDVGPPATGPGPNAPDRVSHRWVLPGPGRDRCPRSSLPEE